MAAPASVLGLFPSFQPGFRVVDGSDLLALTQQLFSSATGITAAVGGGQTAATILTSIINEVTVNATAANSVMLPAAMVGAQVFIVNSTTLAIQVFGQPTNPYTGVGDTIILHSGTAPVATGTGVSQATALVGMYTCLRPGVWKQGLFS